MSIIVIFSRNKRPKAIFLFYRPAKGLMEKGAPRQGRTFFLFKALAVTDAKLDSRPLKRVATEKIFNSLN
jgi:hypothetical protein